MAKHKTVDAAAAIAEALVEQTVPETVPETVAEAVLTAVLLPPNATMETIEILPSVGTL